MPPEATPVITDSISFPDNQHLTALYGEGDFTLRALEEALGVSAISRGNTVSLSGSKRAVEAGRLILESLYGRLERGQALEPGDVEGAIRMVQGAKRGDDTEANLRGELAIPTRKKRVTPRSTGQAEYIRLLYEHELTFAIGPAGTGKTYIAVAMAVMYFMTHQVDRIVLSRPAVEAGEKLGYLPGDLKEKVDPYLRPLYDALYDMLPGDKVAKYLEEGVIEVAPLAYMRGRTLSNSFIILDEAQNATPAQIKMFLTRLGEGSRMAITGDPSQTDLPRGNPSGLMEAVQILRKVKGIGTVQFSDADVVRHPLAARIVNAYEQHEKKQAKQHDGNEAA